ncbi:putative GTP diphosphokinase RSH1, chloroplastic isoform X2 [Magnolia sinica]|uniref:putative GTP diphosphokinase RSH1, chloroplastic isoform X2 n=1 Tax=Magnolia sinica TaxID=86752 RepID=UPI00265A2747|nr:putative GTP diphosphokinase RSH1, chloroplastic isoform X2 [Magnolia sinica]
MLVGLLQLAFEAHDGQKRRSGEPFIIHPVEVARILGELELDWESIAAGLLHDTVEDTDVVTFERIEKEFGATVRHIVEVETKVSKLGKLQCKDSNESVQDVKADDLRQMFLAITEEVRVIIVNLADRLHNMRTLSHMPPHKQSSIALETLQVFAPLAKLLGMYQVKAIIPWKEANGILIVL